MARLETDVVVVGTGPGGATVEPPGSDAGVDPAADGTGAVEGGCGCQHVPVKTGAGLAFAALFGLTLARRRVASDRARPHHPRRHH